jgi:predicted alpha-1,2-mannosidase
LVNPIIGTTGIVDTFPGPDVPFGMMQWSPDTSPTRPIAGGYDYQDSQISGFSLTHLSGAGCGAQGDVPILPYVGTLPADPTKLTTPYTHDSETAQAGYYAVTTGTGDNAVKTELSTTARAGIGRYTFPASTQSHLVFKLNGGTWPGQPVDGTSATIVGDRELVGTVNAGKNFCGHAFTPTDYTLHFDITFRTPFTASAVYGKSANGGPAGVDLTFDTTQTQQLIGKVGISYTSDKNAKQNVAAEIPEWSLDAVRAAATNDWNKLLGKVQIGGGSPQQQVEFYTALYHASLYPSVNSDENGQYLGMDGKVHQVAAGHEEYANYSGWDTYRSQIQLESIVAPQQASDAVTSMLNDYDQSGQLPRWALPNGETYVTAGDPADPIIAGAYAFGARDFDTQHALSAMVAQATQTNNVRQGESTRDSYGYLPYDVTYGGCCNINKNYLVSTELEFDTADHSIAAFANTLGNDGVYNQFATRAQNWQNVFNPATGYMQAKLANGQWAPGFTPGTTAGFEEGTSAQYTPMVPFNLQALITAKGGNAAYSSFLDGLLQNLSNPGPTNANLNDEPSIEIPWEYDYTGAPWQTQQAVRDAQQQLYFDAPAGQFGNDDLGAMSSWFVWSNLGFYPQDPGTDTLVLGSPVFPTSVVHLANGKSLTITAPNAAPDAPYVHGLSVNGKAWNSPWLTFAQLSNGATLDYDLATTPDKTWGAAPSAAPPSDSHGEQPVLASTSGPVSVTAGGSASANVTLRNITATSSVVTWMATGDNGVTVTPDHGEVTVPAGTQVSLPVTVAATAQATGGHTVSFTVKLGSGQAMPTLPVPVTVAATGAS